MGYGQIGTCPVHNHVLQYLEDDHGRAIQIGNNYVQLSVNDPFSILITHIVHVNHVCIDDVSPSGAKAIVSLLVLDICASEKVHRSIICIVNLSEICELLAPGNATCI